MDTVGRTTRVEGRVMQGGFLFRLAAALLSAAPGLALAAPSAYPISAVALKSQSVLVVDADTGETLAAKNADAVTPVASLTKLMTALVVLEAAQPLDETLEITREDVDTY